MAVNKITIGSTPKPLLNATAQPSKSAGITMSKSVHIYLDEEGNITKVENKKDEDQNCYVHTFDDDDNPTVVVIKPGSTVKN